jgi:hypothetical protein
MDRFDFNIIVVFVLGVLNKHNNDIKVKPVHVIPLLSTPKTNTTMILQSNLSMWPPLLSTPKTNTTMILKSNLCA